VWPISLKAAKYLAVFRITLSNHLAYVIDFIVRTLFLLLILYIFTQLWETTFLVTGQELINGYTLKMLMWYLVITESIVMAMPRVVDKVEQEVKNGDVAYFLHRPLSYIGYHYCGFISEALIRVCMNLVIGGLLIYFLFEGISLQWTTVPITVALLISAFTLHFLITMGLSLCAFWIEEVRGYELVYSRLVMILGGMMVPLDIFPHWLEKIARALPFQHIVYVPATHVVGTSFHHFWTALMVQWAWVSVCLVITTCIFYLGVKRLNVNGG
jgi:ABC-2 type transport system permease protein